MRVYNLAFAVHRYPAGSRWHNISLPITLGLGRDADLIASRFDGHVPAWEPPWHALTLFKPRPGQLADAQQRQACRRRKRQEGAHRVKVRHSESQLPRHGVEAEFAGEIRRQWLFTLFAGVMLIAGFGFALDQLLKRCPGA